jgi:hypothetical protein
MALRLRSALLLAVLFATATGYYHLKIFLPRAQAVYAAKGLGNGYFFGGDLYPIWRTAREWRLHRFDPYSSAMTANIQTGLFGRPLDARNPNDPPLNYREFSYPAFVDILALPSTWLPFPVVRVAGASIMFLMTVVGLVLWMGILELRFSPAQWTIVILLTMFSYPVLEGIAAVQLGLMVSVLLAASLATLRKGRELSAGCLLALTLIKPQMTVLVIGCLLVWALSEWRQRWRFAGGLVGGVAVLSLSATFISTSWLWQWLHVVLGYGRYSQPPLPVYLFGVQVGKAFSFVLLAGAVLLAWRIRHMPAKSSEFILTIAGLLAISVIVLLPGQAVYDHILLLPGVLLLLKVEDESVLRTGVGRFTLALAGAAIGWYWIAAVAVVAVSFLAGSLRDAWVLLPVRTAASIPFAVLACLGLSLRSRGLSLLRGRNQSARKVPLQDSAKQCRSLPGSGKSICARL